MIPLRRVWRPSPPDVLCAPSFVPLVQLPSTALDDSPMMRVLPGALTQATGPDAVPQLGTSTDNEQLRAVLLRTASMQPQHFQLCTALHHPTLQQHISPRSSRVMARVNTHG